MAENGNEKNIRANLIALCKKEGILLFYDGHYEIGEMGSDAIEVWGVSSKTEKSDLGGAHNLAKELCLNGRRYSRC